MRKTAFARLLAPIGLGLTLSLAASALANAAATGPSPSPAPAASRPQSDSAPGGKMIENPSGLQYEDIKVGDKAVAVKGKRVTVHYTGTLKDGKKFDSSRDRNEPFVFRLGAGEVIRGWDEGVEGMRVGGRRKLIIPAKLGYGSSGVGGVIPPNSELYFDIELLGVE